MIETAKKHVQETKNEVFLQTATLINGALALVAALAWNEAIKAVIDRYFKAGSGLYSRFVYAIAITVVVVLIARYLGKFKKRYQQEAPKDELV